MARAKSVRLTWLTPRHGQHRAVSTLALPSVSVEPSKSGQFVRPVSSPHQLPPALLDCYHLPVTTVSRVVRVDSLCLLLAGSGSVLAPP
ncbi:hypothetical protein GUJ93_ZPchr0006g43928 [Zizania palustris]|uniref:Uncharacterized protein n=1 Tax=Zizania palustris TaxID=103762 RepID=A0A8J5SRH4_ZIZPA|nr:hypothetical protein GUJ93_ZPchr0006g43928 [Zizania palustris]